MGFITLKTGKTLRAIYLVTMWGVRENDNDPRQMTGELTCSHSNATEVVATAAAQHIKEGGQMDQGYVSPKSHTQMLINPNMKYQEVRSKQKT